MIELKNVTKRYRVNEGFHTIFENVNLKIEKGMNLGILGLNGAGKSTMIRLISGAELPNAGSIERTSSVSWPVGFSGCFSGSLTGRQNLRFVSRIYGANIKEVSKYVEDFAELGEYLDMPIRTYSSGMRSRLAFGLSMAIGFDFYLIDEAFSVGDAVFRNKANLAFQERLKDSSIVFVSHSLSAVKQYCNCAAVLHGGSFSFYADMNDAIKAYEDICRTPSIGTAPTSAHA